MVKLLYVEDNEIIAKGIKEYLERENLLVDISYTIKETLDKRKINIYDLILLDIVLPDGNGLDLYKKFKKIADIPIIFLTAKDSEDDIVKGIDLGADDYIVKPFRMRELTSRIKNILRRNKQSSTIHIKDNLIFDKKNNVIYKNNKQIELTGLEYKLFTILVENINKLVTREYLLGSIWDVSSKFVNNNTLTVYMKRLRKKIEDNPNNPKIIKTIRGIGYKIEN